MREIQLGSVSTGTLRTEDLIDALSGEIKYLEIPNAQKILSEANEITDFDTENASFILEEMFEKLNEYAPPHMQFGSHDSDGANFGWWTTDFENCHTLSIDQGKFVDTECGLYVEVNDHGSMTVKELGGAVIWDCV